MTSLTYKHITAILDDYDAFLFDLWGVVVEGSYNYPGVVDNVNHVINSGKKVIFVTNAPRNITHLLTKLTDWGINASKEMIISSGELAVNMILNSEEIFDINRPLVYHLGSHQSDLIDNLPISTTTSIHNADILLLTLHYDESTNFNLDEFDSLLQKAVNRKIVTICANPDLGIMQQGVYRYCAGYFAAKIKQFGGRVIYTGKPYNEIYNWALNKLPNIPKKRILMIGDTFYTDILGANKIGIDSALVLTGNAAKFHRQYHILEEKLEHIKIAATEEEVMPNFIIALGNKQEFLSSQ
ncbi:TIGR01459 family HAD-type hydrolase [Candidatus Tisiphia endosymbiont of Nemotelus uliginosus]|uniref:TIGR01459 family HAD-type hydrolase n=1 Tax=Candidatus Tisiphia endosymbiont of Nemotelus uliginosus TaxID=3077926 RepID=UPI0035C8FFF0